MTFAKAKIVSDKVKQARKTLFKVIPERDHNSNGAHLH